MNTLKINEEERKKLLDYYGIARNIFIVALIFSLIISFILCINFFHFKKTDPINSKELKNLIETIHRTNDNKELINTVREYDLLIRKAHFTSIAFTKFGSYLLLGFILLLLISLKCMFELKRKLPNQPQECIKNNNINIIYALFFIGFLFIAFLNIYSLLFKESKNEVKPEVKKETSLPKADFANEECMKNNWPAFRGFNSNGIAFSNNPPAYFDVTTNKNIKWKTPLFKYGVNSPIIWDDKIFFSGGDEKSREVYCVDINSGKINWIKEIDNTLTILPNVTEDTGFAAPTMTTNGRYAAAIFATGELVVMDFFGNIIWQKNLPVPKNNYGHSSSLISLENNLFVQYDYDEASKLYAFDFLTGNIIFENTRETEASWASPIIIPYKDKKQLILTAYPYIAAYNPLSGEEIWRMDEIINGEIGPSPAFFDNKLFVVNQFAVLACIDIEEKKVLWTHDEDLSDTSSPVAYNNFLILPTSHGKVTCFNATTKEIYWEEKFKTGFYSSPVISNNLVYLLDKKGVMHIFKLSDKFEIVSNPQINEATVATPAFKDNKIIIRGDKHLFCIEEF